MLFEKYFIFDVESTLSWPQRPTPSFQQQGGEGEAGLKSPGMLLK